MVVDENDTVRGWAAPGFEAVRQRFCDNFTELHDVGAAFAAYRHGEKIVDLWGGLADPAEGRAWAEDTLQVIFSGTKGLAALCLLLLRDRGLLSQDEPVATYWPEFAANGKESVTVRHVLTHQGGVPGIREPLAMTDLLDFDAMAARVAAERLFWQAGEVMCYHPLTFGYIAGELVRRIDGRPINRFFAEEFAAPLGLDAWIGIPPEVESRVATLVHGDWPEKGPYADAPGDPDLVAAIADNPAGRHDSQIPWNEPRFQKAIVPAAGGIASARSMAKLYGMVANDAQLGGRRYFSREALEYAATELASAVEWLFNSPWRMGPGFPLHALAPTVAPEVRSVGHGGAGGSLHGYWPDLGVSFSYAMIEMRVGLDRRGTNLLDALYRSL